VLSAGSFLVHDECQDIRCLSVRGRDSIMHYKVQEEGRLFFIVDRSKFKTLQDLVHHYSTQPAGFLCTALRHPYHVPRGDDEVARSSVRLTHRLGAGKFGEIWHGVKGETHVAVKTLTPGAVSKAEFLREATLLSQLDHPKIIHCEGVCSEQEPVYLLMEFLKFGNLHEFLERGEGREAHFLDLVGYGLQVATGMAYLEGQGYIHCDLAARSIAVGDGRLCKIQNFERARRATTYKLPPRTSVPVRWTAPEVFASNEYTGKADVWAFGVVLLEIITRGRRPYHTMTNEETLKAVQSGYREPQPAGCPRGVYRVMEKCWCESPASRLRFEALEWQLEEFFVSQCFEDRTYVAPFQITH
jgi:fyn-related kinase